MEFAHSHRTRQAGEGEWLVKMFPHECDRPAKLRSRQGILLRCIGTAFRVAAHQMYREALGQSLDEQLASFTFYEEFLVQETENMRKSSVTAAGNIPQSDVAASFAQYLSCDLFEGGSER